MKKRVLVLSGLLGFGVLFGCSQVSNDVSASLPSGFTVITQDEIDRSVLYTLKNDITNCYYTYTTSIYNDAYAPDVEQMFIEKDGVSVPYCEGE